MIAPDARTPIEALIEQWQKKAAEWQRGIGDNQNSRLYLECVAELTAARDATLEGLRAENAKLIERTAHLDSRGHDGHIYSFAALCDSIDSKQLEGDVYDLVIGHIRRAEALQATLEGLTKEREIAKDNALAILDMKVAADQRNDALQAEIATLKANLRLAEGQNFMLATQMSEAHAESEAAEAKVQELQAGRASSGEIAVGAVIALNGRELRVMGKTDGVARNHRGRIAVRNVKTNRLSYVHERRLLSSLLSAAPGAEKNDK